MKKLNILFAIVMLAFVGVSCETYDDYSFADESEFVTVLGFTISESILTFNPGQTEKTTTGTLYINKAASVDRTFTLEVNEALSDLPSENYSFDREVVILANENQVTIEFTAFNVSLEEEVLSAIIVPVAADGLVSGQTFAIRLKKRI